MHVISHRSLQRKQPVSCAGDRSIRARVLCSPFGEDRSVKQEEKQRQDDVVIRQMSEVKGVVTERKNSKQHNKQMSDFSGQHI